MKSAIHLHPYHGQLTLNNPLDVMIWLQQAPGDDKIHEFLLGHDSRLSEPARRLYRNQASVLIDEERAGSGEAIKVALHGAIEHQPDARTIGLFFFPPEPRRGRSASKVLTATEHGPTHFIAKGIHNFLQAHGGERHNLRHISVLAEEHNRPFLDGLRLEFKHLKLELREEDGALLV